MDRLLKCGSADALDGHPMLKALHSRVTHVSNALVTYLELKCNDIRLAHQNQRYFRIYFSPVHQNKISCSKLL